MTKPCLIKARLVKARLVPGNTFTYRVSATRHSVPYPVPYPVPHPVLHHQKACCLPLVSPSRRAIHAESIPPALCHMKGKRACKLLFLLYFNVEIQIRNSLQALLVICFNVEIQVRNVLRALLFVCVPTLTYKSPRHFAPPLTGALAGNSEERQVSNPQTYNCRASLG